MAAHTLKPEDQPDPPQLKKIRGLLSDGAGRILQDYASRVPKGHSVVEIGSYTGKSTCYLATALKPGRHMVAIDTWDLLEEDGWWEDLKHGYSARETFEEALENLKLFGVRDKVNVWRSYSVEAAAKYAKAYDGVPIGLLWLDGDHRGKAVARDLKAWVPLMHDDTQVLFDDYYYSGVSGTLQPVAHTLLYKKRVAHSTGKELKAVFG